jgi:hypothetical protein
MWREILGAGRLRLNFQYDSTTKINFRLIVVQPAAFASFNRIVTLHCNTSAGHRQEARGNRREQYWHSSFIRTGMASGLSPTDDG